MTAKNITSTKSRDIRLDVLKVIGLICIIIAHTCDQDFILQLRSFDVPLMVLISGILFSSSTQSQNYSFFHYLKKRIHRLLAPVWLFLIFLFTYIYLIFFISGKSYYPFSHREIIDSGIEGFVLVTILATITTLMQKMAISFLIEKTSIGKNNSQALTILFRQ